MSKPLLFPLLLFLCVLGVFGVRSSQNIFHKSDRIAQKISQLALIQWSRDNKLWLDNAVSIDPKNEKSDKNYIVFGASAVADAVKIVKVKLGC